MLFNWHWFSIITSISKYDPVCTQFAIPHKCIMNIAIIFKARKMNFNHSPTQPPPVSATSKGNKMYDKKKATCSHIHAESHIHSNISLFVDSWMVEKYCRFPPFRPKGSPPAAVGNTNHVGVWGWMGRRHNKKMPPSGRSNCARWRQCRPNNKRYTRNKVAEMFCRLGS